MKRAFVVLGPESSGTRALTEAFIRAGCEGNSSTQQRFDHDGLTQDLVVVRRSVPHGKDGFDEARLSPILKQLSDYDVTVIVIVRDFLPLMVSQVSWRHTDDLCHADAQVQKAYRQIFEDISLHNLSYLVVTYEGLTESVNMLMSYLGLKQPEMEWRNQNSKHYDQLRKRFPELA